MAQNSSARREEKSAELPSKQTVGAPVVVERLSHPDIPEICALYKRVWETFQPALPSELQKSWSPSPLEFTSWMEGITFFSARRDGKVVGAIGCEIADGSCRIVHLVVAPEARRQAVGTALAKGAVDWARHSGTRTVWVDALDRFSAAHAMFRRLGFAEAGVLHRHRWGEDVRLYELLL
ncbi:MAG TPA: GNAT family N-acetyltransferase [Thermoplasmata archaeon]|nr:GNAT family N-acetyltransferase [Thermoplasmata archaeon]